MLTVILRSKFRHSVCYLTESGIKGGRGSGAAAFSQVVSRGGVASISQLGLLESLLLQSQPDTVMNSENR